MSKVVVVTGFGPFGGYASNPSTDVVKNLENVEIFKNDIYESNKIQKGLLDVQDVKLVTDLMSVEYEEVDKKVHAYWKEHCPDLVVHVGVHGVDKTIKLEQQSFGDGYCRNDVCDKLPPLQQAPTLEKNESIMVSGIDCARVAHTVGEKMKSKCESLMIEPSDDPGRYLCGFSFYISLCHDKSKSLFVHVPDFDDEVTVDVVTEALQLIIKEIIEGNAQKDQN